MRRASTARWAGISLFGLGVLQAAPLLAQGATIVGRITAAASSEPIAEARIIVLGTSLFTTSAADGKYTVRNVPPGTAEVRVIRVGFQEQKKSVRTLSGQTATL